MSTAKKFSRNSKEEVVAKGLAMKNLTQSIYKNVIRGRFLMLMNDIANRLKEDDKEIELTFDLMDYILISVGDELIKNDEFVEMLGKCVKIKPDKLEISVDDYNNFVNYVMNSIGIDLFYSHVINYDETSYKQGRLIEGARIMASNAGGEYYGYEVGDN